MQVRVRPLNKGEVFCCSLSAAKKVFKDTGITLNFAYYGRNYSAFDNTFYSSYLASNSSLPTCKTGLYISTK